MNCDKIFSIWDKQIEKVYYYLKDNINKDFKFNYRDNNCLSLALRESNYLIRYQKCTNCNYVASFLSKDILKDKDEININFGKRKGEKIIFNRYDYQNNKIINLEESKDINYFINKEINKITFHPYNENIYFYGIKNKYLNLALINIILITIAKAKNFTAPPSFINFFICREKISLLNFKYEVNNEKEISNNPELVVKGLMSKENIKDILKQIVIFFLFYEKFNFTHNEASIKFLKFNCELHSFIFNGEEFSSTIKLHIIPSIYSSISIYNSEKDIWARYYNYKKENKHFNTLVEKWYIGWDGIEKKDKDIFYQSCKKFEKGKIIYYFLGKEANKFLYFRRHHGSSIFYKSFDIICFVVSLMIENYFYDSVKKDNELNLIWKKLWLEDEIEFLEKDIKTCKENNFDMIFNIVRKYHIRVDILDYLYHNLFI